MFDTFFPMYWLITGFSGHNIHPAAFSFFPNFYFTTCSRSYCTKLTYIKIQSWNLKKCAHCNAVKQPKAQTDVAAPWRPLFLAPFSVHTNILCNLHALQELFCLLHRTFLRVRSVLIYLQFLILSPALH